MDSQVSYSGFEAAVAEEGNEEQRERVFHKEIKIWLRSGSNNYDLFC